MPVNYHICFFRPEKLWGYTLSEQVVKFFWLAILAWLFVAPCQVFDQFDAGAKDVGSSSWEGGCSYGGHVSREEICASYILLKGHKGEENKQEKKMENDGDVEDALDMSLKLGENEKQIKVRTGANAVNRGKIPLARIERRSLDGGDGVQRGEGSLLYFTKNFPQILYQIHGNGFL